MGEPTLAGTDDHGLTWDVGGIYPSTHLNAVSELDGVFYMGDYTTLDGISVTAKELSGAAPFSRFDGLVPL